MPKTSSKQLPNADPAVARVSGEAMPTDEPSSSEAKVSGKYPLRTQRKAATRRKIIAAALKLAGTESAANVTMAMVAKQADVHVTTLFTHFASKAELFSGISEPAITALQQRIEASKGQVPFFEFVKTTQQEFAAMMALKGQEMVDHALYMRTQVELLPAWIDFEKNQANFMTEYIVHDYGTSETEARLFAGMIVSANIHSFDLWLTDPEGNDLKELTSSNINHIEKIFHRACGEI